MTKIKDEIIREPSGEYSMEKMCRVLQVSYSGYYAWQACPENATGKKNQEIYGVVNCQVKCNSHEQGLQQEFPAKALLIVEASCNSTCEGVCALMMNEDNFLIIADQCKPSLYHIVQYPKQSDDVVGGICYFEGFGYVPSE